MTMPDTALVERLLAEQFPELAGQAVRPSPAEGSSNVVFRVGAEWAVRLPRTDDYTADLLTEARWLPRLAPELDVSVPEVLFEAQPSELFPRPWTVVSWLPGEPPGTLGPDQQLRLATGLGRFTRQLHRLDVDGIDATDVTALRSGYRAGEPVTKTSDGWVETAAAGLRDLFDPGEVAQAWRRLRQVPPASEPPGWIHTDLSAENLLVDAEGGLVGVLDFGGLGIGDRSVDFLYAWSMLEEPAREVLRREAEVGEATWRRARAWAFAGPGLLTLLHYRDSMPERTARLTAMVEAVAAEVGVQLR